MHEFSIAADIMETISEFAAAHPDKEILEVCVQLGELTCVEAQQLKFCYTSLVENSELKGSSLEIETVQALVQCPHCHYHGAPRRWDDALTISVPTLQCPRCGRAAEATAGHDCKIRSVRFARREIQNTP